MKPKKKNQKLSLNKKTVANLNRAEMDSIHGGNFGFYRLSFIRNQCNNIDTGDVVPDSQTIGGTGSCVGFGVNTITHVINTSR